MLNMRFPSALRMPGKNLIMFVLSLGLGAAGIYYTKQYIEQQIAFYKQQADKTEEMVEIVVPNRQLRQGDVLLGSDLSVREIPIKYADSNSVNASTYEVAVGQRLDFDIDQGRPLLWAHLSGGINPTFSGKVSDGLRAMTVRVDEINSISGFLQPKDKVDLLLSYGSGSEHRILPLIQKLDVIATGVRTEINKSNSGNTRPFSTITVHVSPADAQRITLAQQVGKLTAMLRNPDDEAALNERPITVAELLGKSEPVPVKPARVSTKPAPKRVPKTDVVEYIIGGR